MKGEYEIAIQKDNRGYYAKASLDVEYDKSHDQVKIEFEKRFSNDWQTAMKFGIEYAWEKIPHQNGINVKVLELQWNILDTTNIIVAFATIHALWDALKFTPKIFPRFDEVSEMFVFPKLDEDQGMSESEVKPLHTELQKLGYAIDRLEVDQSYFGQSTKKTVRAF